MGQFTICMHIFFIAAQILMLRKNYPIIQLLQIAVSFLFGFYTDLTMWITGLFQFGDTPIDYVARALQLCVGGGLLAYGISFEVAPLTQWQAYTVTSASRLDRIAANFDTTASELAKVNGLSEKVRLGAGSTLLVPGSGSSISLNNLLNTSAPQHIIEPEPVVHTCGKTKRGKHATRKCSKHEQRLAAKGSKGGSKAVTGKSGARQTASATKSGKASTRSAASKASGHSKGKGAAATKPAKSGAKVSKSGRGRRG